MQELYAKVEMTVGAGAAEALAAQPPTPNRGGRMAARGRISIDAEYCKGCELCTTVCPQGVIKMADWFNAKGYRPAQLVDPQGECTGCAVCAVICPDAVITVYRTVTPRAAVAAAAA
jgi:2-oxoglutarate ferredoxin oxidoreductase subunit delta